MTTPRHTLDDVRAVHLVGIGGAGVSALARLFALRGVRVTGSDAGPVREHEALLALGVTILPAHNTELIPAETEALVYSPAVPENDPERVFARMQGILEYSYPEALGALMAGRYGVAVSGTNGKTTTTALLGLMLAEGGIDPTVVVGGTVPAWQGNFKFGESDMFVAEGCEYRRHMLNLSPRMIVLTNIAADHLDYYRDLEDIKDAFKEYVHNLPEDGVLVYNADDSDSVAVSRSASARIVSFSIAGTDADVCATDMAVREGKQHFTVVHRGNSLGVLATRLPGDFNRANILAAAAAALELGVSFEAIKRAVEGFSGVRRRFEYVGEYHGAPVISDYAHHPDAVRGTIEAARTMYPGKTIVAVFQPHQIDRTIKLFDGFVDAFAAADRVIIPEIYQVTGREEGGAISARDVVSAINERHRKDAQYAQDLDEAETLLDETVSPKSVVLVMGAGDVDNLARALPEKSMSVVYS